MEMIRYFAMQNPLSDSSMVLKVAEQISDFQVSCRFWIIVWLSYLFIELFSWIILQQNETIANIAFEALKFGNYRFVSDFMNAGLQMHDEKLKVCPADIHLIF